VDGPAGAGKSTVCKILAETLGFVYLDTGAMYRALAWAIAAGSTEPDMHSQGGGKPESRKVSELLAHSPLRFTIEAKRLMIFYGDRCLSKELREPRIGDTASRISQLPEVREFMVSRQRQLARQNDVVAEGRDTATAVFPQADLKVFLTANLQARAERRFAEYIEKGIGLSLEEILESIRLRDEADANRDHSPLRPAEGAVLLDTSHLNIQQVVECLKEKAQKLTSPCSSA
jgi:cytidylate kinase